MSEKFFDFDDYYDHDVIAGTITDKHMADGGMAPSFSKMKTTPIYMVICGNVGASVHYSREGAEKAREELLSERPVYKGKPLKYPIRETILERLRREYVIKP